MIQIYAYDLQKTAQISFPIRVGSLVKSFQGIFRNTLIYQIFLVLTSNANIKAKGGENK